MTLFLESLSAEDKDVSLLSNLTFVYCALLVEFPSPWRFLCSGEDGAVFSLRCGFSHFGQLLPFPEFSHYVGGIHVIKLLFFSC